MSLEQLLQRAELWRGGRTPCAKSISTCDARLDTLLGGGWPQGALVEVLSAHSGIGELRLVLPTLAQLSRHRHWLAFIAPPYIPYAPALYQAGIDLQQVLVISPDNRRDIQWSLEQSLRSATGGAVLAWLDTLSWSGLRRLQLAAEAGNCLGFVYRRDSAGKHSSPAALRLRLLPETGQRLRVQVLKRRGGWPGESIALEMHDAVAGPVLS